MTIEDQSTPRTVFKSAFGHSLRTSPPIPIPEHLAHLTVAILAGQYVFKVHSGDKLSLELSLPDYSSDKSQEGDIILIPNDAQIPEEGMKMLEHIKSTTNPSGMIRQNARGALLSMFEYVSEKREQIGSVGDLKALKAKSLDLITKALEEVKANSEVVTGRTIVEMDTIIAGAEATILAGLHEASGENNVLVEYFDRIIQLHNDLALDTTIDSDPPMGCCGEESGCCGAGECDDDACCAEENCSSGPCCGQDDHQHH